MEFSSSSSSSSAKVFVVHRFCDTSKNLISATQKKKIIIYSVVLHCEPGT